MIRSVEGIVARRLLVNAVVEAEMVRPLLPNDSEPVPVGPDGDEAASRFFGAANEASSPSRRPGGEERIRMAAPPFDVRSVRVRELVLDRLAWALGGLSPAALRFDSAFLVRDVPVRFSPVAAA